MHRDALQTSPLENTLRHTKHNQTPVAPGSSEWPVSSCVRGARQILPDWPVAASGPSRPPSYSCTAWSCLWFLSQCVGPEQEKENKNSQRPESCGNARIRPTVWSHEWDHVYSQFDNTKRHKKKNSLYDIKWLCSITTWRGFPKPTCRGGGNKKN